MLVETSTHKVIFIHIPKTGGTSISAALISLFGDAIGWCPDEYINPCVVGEDKENLWVWDKNYKNEKNEHLNKHETLQTYANVLGERLKEFSVFTSVRNPYDRVISRVRWYEGVTKDAIIRRLPEIKPCVEFCKVDNKIIVENFIRFENIKEDFEQVCAKLNLPKLELGHKNKSNRDVDYRKYYDDETYTKVTEQFKEDLDFFGYTF